MKIIGIDPEHTDQKQTAFVTDPPLTEDIFRLYAQAFQQGNLFKRKGGLLVAEREIPKEYLADTEQMLTQFEQQIARNIERAKKDRADLLDRVSKQTGLPIIDKSTVPDAGPVVGEAQ